MSATDPASVRALLCGGAERDAIVAAMARRLPGEGLTAVRTRGRFNLMRATYRLLDSRVLECLVRALDQDMARPLAEWLAEYQNLREVAARTVADPPEEDAVATLLDPHPFSSTQASQVSLYVGEEAVATFDFQMRLEVLVAGVAVAVRAGAIEEVRCAVFTGSVTVTLAGLPQPLWEPDPVTLPELGLPVQPPVRIPLVPVPRPEERPTPRPSTQRPPVPPPAAATHRSLRLPRKAGGAQRGP